MQENPPLETGHHLQGKIVKKLYVAPDGKKHYQFVSDLNVTSLQSFWVCPSPLNVSPPQSSSTLCTSQSSGQHLFNLPVLPDCMCA